MSKRRLNLFSRTVTVIVLSLAMVFSASMGGAAATLDELQDKQKQLESQKEENDKKLLELKDDTEDKIAYRDVLYQQIDTLKGQLDELRQEIEKLNKDIANTEVKISQKQKEIDENMELFRARIKAMYMTGETGALSMVLDSRNLLDFTERAEVIQKLSAHDQKLISLLTKELDDVRVHLDEINRDKAELGEKKKSMETKSVEMGKLYEEAQQLVTDAQGSEKAAIANSELLHTQIEENEAAITELEAQLKTSGIAISGGYVGTGNFTWPMPGYTYLTCYFGEDGHRGIDIAGGDIYGKSIVAADGGTVQYAGWNDSYGYCVFIDHGNGYQTRYAHMCELGTTTGASVSQGETIGYVGSTGNSTGPHLHFEVICNESLIDPMTYY